MSAEIEDPCDEVGGPCDWHLDDDRDEYCTQCGRFRDLSKERVRGRS